MPKIVAQRNTSSHRSALAYRHIPVVPPGVWDTLQKEAPEFIPASFPGSTAAPAAAQEQPQSSQTETLQPPRQPAPDVGHPPTDVLRSAAAEALAEAPARSHTADSADEADVGQAAGSQSQAAEAGRDASEDQAEARRLDGRPGSSAAGAPEAAARAAAPSDAALDGRGAIAGLEIEEQAAYIEVSITELSAFVVYEAATARRDGATPKALRAAWDRLPPEDQAARVPRQPRREFAMDKKWAPLLSRNTDDQLETWDALDIPLSLRRP
ncbi:unnamed protein product [Prorocentrum cordatum]|uniref:Uncharacterized protein n=1 Tax=Prorocentrum cordatum TaxID=2364126 RepID=A0ABN9UQG7_9DINO|nr:unnamed protein product [Polarella glacialis]